MEKGGTPPDGEELAAVQEQLADARAQLERFQSEAANAEARAEQALDAATALRDQLQTSTDAGAAAVADSTALRAQLEQSAQRGRADAERYRDLLLSTEPSLPADLIAGDDIDAVDASVSTARAIVGRVRTHIEAQAQAGRVPAGAPPRSAPDLSALTPEQKIRYGLAART